MKYIHKNTKTTIVFLAILLFSVFVSACSSTTKSEDPTQATAEQNKAEGEKSLAHIIFITTSRACDCTLTRCKNSEATLQKALASYPNAPQIERIDFAEEQDKARSLTQKHGALMLPVALFIDSKDGLLNKLEGEFTEDNAQKVLQLCLEK